MASYPYRVRISPDVISQEVLLGETVLMDVKRLVYFGLDEFGTKVWKEFQLHPDADEVFKRLSASSEMPRDGLEAKFASLIQGLAHSQVIELHRKHG